MRYVITDDLQWGHIFEGGTSETMCLFAFDRQENRLVAGMVPGGFGAEGQWWTPMSARMLADLEDSLVNANPDALSNPDDWGLSETDDLPEWASDCVAEEYRP